MEIYHHGNDADESTPLVLWEKKRVVAHDGPRASSKKKPLILGAKDPKWILLALCCVVMGSMYYILAMPAALHLQLNATMPTSDDNFEMNFNLLFTVSYFPNMFLPMFGGAIVDKYGEAKCLLAFCLVVWMGQALTALGASLVEWKWMLAGRLVFGLGAQNLIVANAALLSKWFVGTEGVALGLSNVCSYAGVILTNIASPRLANSVGTAFAFWLGAGVQVFAIALALVILLMDHRNKEKLEDEVPAIVCSPMYSPIVYNLSAPPRSKNTTTTVQSPGVRFGRKNDPSVKTDAPSGIIGKIQRFKATFWLLCISFLLVYGVVWSFTNVSSGILLERDFFRQTPSDCVLLHPDHCTSGNLVPENPAMNSEGHQCPMEGNYAPAIPRSLNVTVVEDTDDFASTTFDHTIYKFQSLQASDIQCQDDFWAEACTMNYCHQQALATEKAGVYMSIPYFFTVALTFHLGLLVDSTGWRTELICLGSALLVSAHALLAYPPSSPPLVPLVTQGLGYTMCVAALWPSVPFTVSEDSVGTAFGIMMGVQNVGLAIIPLVVAHLYRLGDGHYLPYVEIFFMVCSFSAVIVGFALMVADRKTDHVLATPKIDIPYLHGRRKEIEAALKHRGGKGRANSDAALDGLPKRANF